MHTKSAACVIIIIIKVPVVVKVVHLNRQVYQAFLLLQLPYGVSVLLLMSACTLVPVYTIQALIINWCLHDIFHKNMLLEMLT